ncbi:MAG: N-acetyltransferase, partial [Clostridia bacterium]|nr:N-acetyltransferase [Clostridia bacterium]
MKNTIPKKPSVIITERLIMRSYRDSDMENAIALLCNDNIKKTYMIPDFSSREDAVLMFHKIKDLSYSDKHFEYGIYLKEQLIGFINDVETDDESIEIGYVIHPDMQGNGYATEILSAAIRELFKMGYSVVKAGFFEENIASRR